MPQHMRQIAAGLGCARGVLLLPVVGERPRERQAADVADGDGFEACPEAVVVV
jgi:hypothetical protein